MLASLANALATGIYLGPFYSCPVLPEGFQGLELSETGSRQKTPLFCAFK